MAAALALVAAALASLNQGLNSGLSAGQLTANSVKSFNVAYGDTNVWKKSRVLEIRITNLHPQMRLRMDDSWFDTGAIYMSDHPASDVYPGQTVTFQVSNVRWLSWVSGGVGFKVIGKDTKKELKPGWLVCTFSNPRAGSIKGKVAFKGPGIKELWKTMRDAKQTRDEYTGFWKQSDRVLQFVFKSPSLNW